VFGIFNFSCILTNITCHEVHCHSNIMF